MLEKLLDNTTPVYVALGLAELVIVLFWRRGRGRAMTAALIGPPVLALALAVVGMFVVTDRQKLQRALRDIASDVEKGDMQAVGEYLADDYNGIGGTREGAIEFGQGAVKSYGIRNVSLSKVEIEVTGSQAKVTARSIVTYDMRDFGAGRTSLDWTVYWAQRQGQWKIINVGTPVTALGL